MRAYFEYVLENIWCPLSKVCRGCEDRTHLGVGKGTPARGICAQTPAALFLKIDSVDCIIDTTGGLRQFHWANSEASRYMSSCSQAAASTVLSWATLPNSIPVASSALAVRCHCALDGGWSFGEQVGSVILPCSL